MSADVYRKLSELEELERQEKYLARCKDNFVYKRPVGIALYFREPIAVARSENKKQIEEVKKREEAASKSRKV
ncbi:hypothetical protein Q1695_014196 [Nippostrongylus brasiliensis]|nr:hypothetical protein Q1695_014196 [Nippostrongylus brasiliensis]